MRRIVRFFLSVPVLRILILKVPALRRVYPPWWKTHPIDVQYGIDTSGSVAVDQISSDKKLVSLICPYLGSQPSIVRAALSELTDCENHTFIDLGCGKGRALIVASEFPFRSILGVELSPTLAAIARTNIAKVASRFPFRSRAMITVGNVTEFPLPPGKLAVFNYHAFGPEIVKQVVERLEAALAAETLHLFFVYYNPVYYEILDVSPAFTRYYQRAIPCDESEIGFGPGLVETVAIWQSVRGAIPSPHARV